MLEQHTVAEAFDVPEDYNIDDDLARLARLIVENTGLLDDYNDGDAYFAESGDVLCIMARTNRSIPNHVLREAQTEGLRVSQVKSKEGQGYIEVRPE